MKAITKKRMTSFMDRRPLFAGQRPRVPLVPLYLAMTRPWTKFVGRTVVNTIFRLTPTSYKKMTSFINSTFYSNTYLFFREVFGHLKHVSFGYVAVMVLVIQFEGQIGLFSFSQFEVTGATPTPPTLKDDVIYEQPLRPVHK